MNTPIQELIEKFNKLTDNYEFCDWLEANKECLLEKEKQMVIDAFRDGIKNVHNGSPYTTPLTYYNQTFKNDKS